MFPVNLETEKEAMPPVIIKASEDKPKMSKTKKYAVIGLSAFLLVGLLLTGILVGMYIFTRAQTEMVEYTLKLNGGRSQEVTSDTGANVVKYHVMDTNQESWVVNDFNTNIKVTKISSKSETTCYITPLNRSTAMEPSKVTKPTYDGITEPSKHNALVYQISTDVVSDTSFLTKDARNMCKGVSAYWIYPSCSGDTAAPANSNISAPRVNKREAPYYTISSVTRNGVNYPCVNGCCKTVCACRINFSWTVVGGSINCNWAVQQCCAGTSNCYFSQYAQASKGLQC